MSEQKIAVALCVALMIVGILSIPIMEMDITFMILSMFVGISGIVGTLFHVE